MFNIHQKYPDYTTITIEITSPCTKRILVNHEHCHPQLKMIPQYVTNVQINAVFCRGNAVIHPPCVDGLNHFIFFLLVAT